MEHTSARSKQCFNSEYYTQLKVYVEPNLAKAFKSACYAAGVSMSSTISSFMVKYSDIDVQQKGYSPNLSTKRQRRAAVRSLICQLERIRDNEENYRDNIPANLQGSLAFDLADQSISLINEAVELLETAY